MSAEAVGQTRTAEPTRAFARAAGNVFLGIAIGLLAYSGITNLVTNAEQAELRDAVPAASAEVVVAGPETPELDFIGWAGEDVAYWKALPEGGAFGRLVAEKISLDSVVVKGTARADLRKGPGWITWTDLPGPTGNCGISGHRTTYGAPFRRIDVLEPGDTIRFYSPYRRYTYRVVKKLTVRPDQVEVVESTEEPMLTLTACHPPYSARQRIIVQSELIEVVRLEP